jgi:hypothetical protein
MRVAAGRVLRAAGVERLLELLERGGLLGRDRAVELDDEVGELEERLSRAVGEVGAVARVVGLKVGDADGRAVEPRRGKVSGAGVRLKWRQTSS